MCIRDSGEPWPAISADEVLQVQINNVLINSAPQSFSYVVRIFDPTVAGIIDEIPTIDGPLTGELDTPERFDLTQVSFAKGYNLRSGKLAAFTAIEDAEGSAEFVTDMTDSAYPLFSTDTAVS